MALQGLHIFTIFTFDFTRDSVIYKVTCAGLDKANKLQGQLYTTPEEGTPILEHDMEVLR